MPYIITTRKHWHGPGAYYPGRRAVATLDEVREETLELIAELADGEAQREAASAALTIPDNGWTIGPLPDGTTIEIKQRSYVQLAEALGRSPSPLLGAYSAGWQTRTLDAYNAAQ